MGSTKTRRRGQSSRARNETSSPPRKRKKNPTATTPIERVVALSKRKIISTRYLDTFALGTLGLLNEVIELVSGAGLGPFMMINTPTFRELTLEFLNAYSFEPEIFEGKFGKISFRLLNEEYEMNLERFNELLGCPGMGGRKKIPNEFEDEEAWRELTEKGGYIVGMSKSTELLSPALRYLHRVLAHSLFGRGESTGTVTRNELFILHCMVHKVSVNAGWHLAMKFQSVAKATSGAIVVGGFITQIAMNLGLLNLKNIQLEKIEGNDRIDLDTLHKMEMVTRHGNTYRLATKESIPQETEVGSLRQEEQRNDEEEKGENVDGEDMEMKEPHMEEAVGTSTNLDLVIERIDAMQAIMNERFWLMEERLVSIERANARRYTNLEDQLKAYFAYTGFHYQPPPPPPSEP